MRYATFFRRLLIVTALLSTVSIASAAEVRGRLLLGPYQPPTEETPRAGFHWELDNGFKETLRDRVAAEREVRGGFRAEREYGHRQGPIRHVASGRERKRAW